MSEGLSKVRNVQYLGFLQGSFYFSPCVGAFGPSDPFAGKIRESVDNRNIRIVGAVVKK